MNDVTESNPHPVPRRRKPQQEQEEERAYEPESFRPHPPTLRKDLDLDPVKDRDYAWASTRRGQGKVTLVPEDTVRNAETGQVATVMDSGPDWYLVKDVETGNQFFLNQEDLENPTSTVKKVF